MAWQSVACVHAPPRGVLPATHAALPWQSGSTQSGSWSPSSSPACAQFSTAGPPLLLEPPPPLLLPTTPLLEEPPPLLTTAELPETPPLLLPTTPEEPLEPGRDVLPTLELPVLVLPPWEEPVVLELLTWEVALLPEETTPLEPPWVDEPPALLEEPGRLNPPLLLDEPPPPELEEVSSPVLPEQPSPTAKASSTGQRMVLCMRSLQKKQNGFTAQRESLLTGGVVLGWPPRRIRHGQPLSEREQQQPRLRRGERPVR